MKIHDKVKIVPLERNGKITAILENETGIKYFVRYFDNAEVKSEYFYQDELELKYTDKK